MSHVSSTATPSTHTPAPCITRIEHGVNFSRVFITSSNRRSCCQDFELENGSTRNSHPKNKNPKLSHWLGKGPASSQSKATASKKHVHLIWRDKDRHPTSIPEPFRLSPPYLVQQGARLCPKFIPKALCLDSVTPCFEI